MSGPGGPVVVVGGGAAGLGRAIVDALLASGARVVVPARTESVAERLYLEVEPERVPALRAAVGTLGADRMVLGSDFPYETGDMYDTCVKYIANAGLKPEEVTAIQGGTAAAMLKLEVRS